MLLDEKTSLVNTLLSRSMRYSSDQIRALDDKDFSIYNADRGLRVFFERSYSQPVALQYVTLAQSVATVSPEPKRFLPPTSFNMIPKRPSVFPPLPPCIYLISSTDEDVEPQDLSLLGRHSHLILSPAKYPIIDNVTVLPPISCIEPITFKLEYPPY